MNNFTFISLIPWTRAGVSSGSEQFLCWKTKHDNNAAISSGGLQNYIMFFTQF